MLAAGQDVNPAGWARVQFVRDLPDGRRFVNDSRGFLYLLDKDNKPAVYVNFAKEFPFAIYNRLESGVIGFDFHPEFAKNGLFYTVHGERAMGNPAKLNFIPPGTPRRTCRPQRDHGVAREEPGREHFEGTRRELFRVAHVVMNLTHPFGFVGFNPTAKPGSPDYGLLYTSGSDTGFSNGGGPNANNPSQTQRLDSVITAILRLIRAVLRYRRERKFSATTPFRQARSSLPTTIRRRSVISHVYGFRNAHRMSWDLTDGTMDAFDIGMNQIEEINIVRNGENYGWMKREGYWKMAPSGLVPRSISCSRCRQRS